jgi:hypothetical protein
MPKDHASNLTFGKPVVADKVTRLSNRSDSAEMSKTASLGGADCQVLVREFG